jgi:hypothetical protein
MSVSSALIFPPSPDTQAEAGELRPIPVVPGSGEDSYGKTIEPQNAPAAAAGPEDEVKMQFESPGDIAVYRFVNQQGTLILQVPSQPMLDLASQISQELAQEAALKEPATAEGGKQNGR